MRRLTLCAAAVSILLGVCAPARAADKALVDDVNKDLAVSGDHYDERAVLAALLARPAESAAFDAEAKVSLSDPKLRALFLQKWRGKLAAFAATEAKHPDVDLTRTYANWTEIMSPEQRAYTAQRMLTMSADNRDKLVYYLKKLNDSLASNGGRIDTGIFSISKRIVAGVMDQYRADLNAYVATPQAADGRAHGAAAAAQLARDLAPKPAPAPAPAPEIAAKPIMPTQKPTVAAKPAAKPAPLAPAATRPAPPPPSPIPHVGAAENAGGPTPSGALNQAKAADQAGQAAGAIFDGGQAAPGVAAATGGPGSAAGNEISGALSPSNAAAPAGLTASEPPAPGARGDVDLMKQIEGMGSGKAPSFGWVKVAGAGLLGLLGGLIGFLVGGPVGAAIGAAVGAAAGYGAASAVIRKFT